MIEHSKLKDIRWECGWNAQHFRGKVKKKRFTYFIT